MRDEEAARVRELAQRLLEMTDPETEGLMFRSPQPDPPLIDLIDEGASRHDTGCLLRAAQSEAARRRLRKNFLPAEWFSEGPWNILVDLFECEHFGRQVSITDACIAADVPSTTAIRHIAQLVEAQLVQRIPDPADHRRCFLRLTHHGLNTMTKMLGSMLDAEIAIKRRLAGKGGITE